MAYNLQYFYKLRQSGIWTREEATVYLNLTDDLAHSDTTAGIMYQKVLTLFWVSFKLDQKYCLFYTGAGMTSILNKQGNTALACLISPISS